MLRDKIEKVLIEQKLWDEDKQKQYDENVKIILDGELEIKKGGIKKSEARKLALDMRVARFNIQQLSAERNKLDLMSAEAAADNARFNYWVSASPEYRDWETDRKSVV